MRIDLVAIDLWREHLLFSAGAKNPCDLNAKA